MAAANQTTQKGGKIAVPIEHWANLRRGNLHQVCKNAGADLCGPGDIAIRFLTYKMLVCVESGFIFRLDRNCSRKLNNPLLELVTLVYLLNAGVDPIRNEMIGVNQLRDAHFFQGPHALNLSRLLSRYGDNPSDFHAAAAHLGGSPMALADAAFRLLPYPKTPLYYLLWEGDDEFGPHISVLFDRTIERHLSADAIWGLVNLVSEALFRYPVDII